MNKYKKEQIKKQIKNLRRLDVIINNKIINDEPEKVLDTWLADWNCGTKGCVLGDYVLQHCMTGDLIDACGLVWENDRVVSIKDLYPFNNFCESFNSVQEFGLGYKDFDAESVFASSAGPSYKKRLKIVRKAIKVLEKKLKVLKKQ